MQVVKHKAERSACDVELEVEVPVEAVNDVLDQVYREFSRVTEVPGFRRGKAPRKILELYVPDERVKARAEDKLVALALASAVEEAGIEPFGVPDVEIIRFEKDSPFLLKAAIPLAPRVELGQYVGLEVDRLVPAVTDEHVQREIDELRQRSAPYQMVEGRPVQMGDRVTVEILDRSDPEDTPDLRPVVVGENVPSFDEGLIGMSVGEEKTIEVTYPDDFRDKTLVGTTKPLHVKVVGIEEKVLPEATDEWARSLGREYESLEDLRKKIRSELERSAAILADRQVEWKIVEKIIENSEVCYPEVMREEEVKHRLEELRRDVDRLKMTLDEYLRDTGRTLEQLQEEIRKSADRDLKVWLVLSRIAEKENIQVEEAEVEQEIRRLANERRVPVESFMAYVDKTGTRESIRERLLRRRVLDFLVHASNIRSVGQSS